MNDGAPNSQTSKSVSVQCCIVGGGPAGMMLGYLLGRAGIKTAVLEKHADFFRDLRGDFWPCPRVGPGCAGEHAHPGLRGVPAPVPPGVRPGTHLG